MFRSINIKEDVVLKIDLYKNRREKICEIPLDCIEGITYKFNDIDEVSLKIPRYVFVRGKMETNHVYQKINTRQQIVITTISKDGSETKQRFVLHSKKVAAKLKEGSKTFVAYSWEKTLEKHRITVEQLSRQLTNKNDSVNVAEGILDLICKKTGWTVGEVDEDARYKTSTSVETFSKELYSNFSKETIAANEVIFDKAVTIPASADKPTYLNINYTNLKTYHNGTTLANVNILNNLSSTPFYTTIKRIKAEQYSETGNRYGIKYTFTLDIPTTATNKTNTVEVVSTFTNCAGKSLACDKIFVTYDYGDLVEKRNIQYANFEAFDDSAYKFLADVEEVFDCMFTYDTMNNVINVHARANLQESSGYTLELGRNMSEVNITEDDEIITCLKVESDNTSIASENPNGTNIIENYDYYIRHGLISDELKVALEEYNKLAEVRQEQWLRLKDDRSVLKQRYTKAQSEATTLEQRIKHLTFLLTTYISDNNLTAEQERLQTETKLEKDQLEIRYNSVIREMAQYQSEISTIDDRMAELSVNINRNTAKDNNGNPLFTEEDLQELNDMQEIATYTDSYYTTSYGLYNYAVRYMEEKVKPTITVSLSTEELKGCISNINGWNYVLKIGNIFELEENDVFTEFDISQVRLTEYKLTPKEGGKRFSVNSFVFTNKINKDNALRVGSNIGRTTNKTNGVMTTFRELWENSKVVNNFVGDMITSGLNIAAANIKGGVYRNILDFSEAGCFIINNTNGDTNNQIYLGGGTIAITTDAWESSKVAIDANGVIAETLMGRILLGEQLVITGEEGLFYVGDGTTSEQKKNDEFGIYIYDEGKVIDRIFLGVAKEGNTKRAMLRLKDRQGNQVVLSDEGIVQTHQFVCWDNISANYPMRIPYFCDEGVKENRKVMLSLVFEKYRAFEKGAASGGSVKSSKSGGGGTSASGGGGTSSSGGGGTSSSGGGGTSNAAGSTTVNTSSAWGGSIDTTITSVAQEYSTFPEKRQTSIPNTSTFAGHYHYIDPDFFLHRHKIDLSLPSHSHSISVSVPSHSHTIPNHTHTMPNHSHTIPNHTHTIPNHTHTMPDHTHDFDFTHSHNLEYGIYEQNSKCSNVYVYVNNTKVNSSPINSNVSLNITKHIKIGQRNDIRIETETNGRVSCNLFTKSFVAF